MPAPTDRQRILQSAGLEERWPSRPSCPRRRWPSAPARGSISSSARKEFTGVGDVQEGGQAAKGALKLTTFGKWVFGAALLLVVGGGVGAGVGIAMSGGGGDDAAAALTATPAAPPSPAPPPSPTSPPPPTLPPAGAYAQLPGVCDDPNFVRLGFSSTDECSAEVDASAACLPSRPTTA